MNKSQKLISALGLARKAGKLASGDTALKFAVKSGKVNLILMAEDVSDNSKKELINLAKLYNIALSVSLTKQELGRAIGKAERAAVAVVDKNFATMIKKQLDIID